uniref:mRNA capping enzyme adenylation domain-containing protein n=1 Tax=viral metagenome TaxID=1070528 RepID=A0A6C0JJM8_9ZZZZ
MELTQAQISHLLNRFPEFELSYETISHNKVSPDYDIAIAIPTGKKGFIWFTFHQDDDVCYLLDSNKDKKITKAIRLDLVNLEYYQKLALGTVLYGTILIDELTGKNTFILEDVYLYQGLSLKKQTMNHKLSIMLDFFDHAVANAIQKKEFVFMLPMMWYNNENELNGQQNGLPSGSSAGLPSGLPSDIQKIVGYTTHHIQHRSTSKIMPYVNIFLNRKLNGILSNAPLMCSDTTKTQKQSTHIFETQRITMDFSKPQYKYPTVFQVTADIQFDIYHLFAYGRNKNPVYYNIAYIPNCKSSAFMNGLFRKIRENKNLDYIEESDDDDDFQNMEEDKYVDINKVLLLECTFHQKFKRWVPVRVVDKYAKVVHLNKLVR